MRLVLPLAQHGGCNLDATVNRQQNPLSKAGCESVWFLRAGTWQALGMRAQIGVQPGAFRNSEGAVARPDTVTCQDGGDRYDKKTNENGKLTAHVRKINNSTIT
jgi:hypothetical protein